MHGRRLVTGFRRRGFSAVTTAVLALALTALPFFGGAATVLATGNSAAASAMPSPSDHGPAGGDAVVVSAMSSPYGRVLDSGGFSLYYVTSDYPTSSGFHYGCTPPPPGVPVGCTTIWPPLTTDTATGVMAGPGIDPMLLGTVFRSDLGTYQVTYAGHPLYRFSFDHTAGATNGEDLNEPASPPTHGIWYLVSPTGLPNPGEATLTSHAVALSSTTSATVLAAVEGATDFTVTPPAVTHTGFTVYAYSLDTARSSACTGLCADFWPPVLTTMRAQATVGVDQHGIGVIVRTDGTHQVTYDGHPLYLFVNEASSSSATGNGIMPHFGGEFTAVAP